MPRQRSRSGATLATPGISLLGVGPEAALARRIARLAATSVFGLGAVWFLEERTLFVRPEVGAALACGWVLMPAILAASLWRPWLRYALTLPASLVTAALAFVCLTALPAGLLAQAGWLLLTGGVALGAVLGMWLWYRWMPVPAALADPESPGRWALVGLHVALVLAGLSAIWLAA